MSTVSLIFVGLLITFSHYDAASVEKERSAFDLQNMMSQVAKDSPLKYSKYGNWCGLGGSGEVKDTLDQCCMVHDKCYDLLQEGVCKDVSWWLGKNAVYVNTYEWKYFPDKNLAMCVDGQEPCAAGLCNCDLIFSNCIRDNKKYYKNKYYHAALW